MRLYTLGKLSLETSEDQTPVLPSSAKLPLLLLTYLHTAGSSVGRDKLATTFWGDDPTPYPPRVETRLARWLYCRLLEGYRTGETRYPFALPEDVERCNDDLKLKVKVRASHLLETLENFQKLRFVITVQKSRFEIVAQLNPEYFRTAIREEKPYLRNLRNHLIKLRPLQLEGRPLLKSTALTLELGPLPSDWSDLRAASRAGQHDQVVLLAARGEFLAEFQRPEEVARTHLSESLFKWIREKRGEVADLEVRSHMKLAQRARLQSQVEQVQQHALRVRRLYAEYPQLTANAPERERELTLLERRTTPRATPSTPLAVPVEVAYVLSTLEGRLVGREVVLRGVLRQLETNPLVTLVGAAGVGKTTLARAVLETARATPSFYSRALFLDLESLLPSENDEAVLLDLLGRELGVSAQWSAVSGALSAGPQRCLVILNNVEQFLHTSSSLLATVERLARLGNLRLLLTTREEIPTLEALGARYRLHTLALPAPGMSPKSLEQARACSPAVALFLDRLERVGSITTLKSADFEHIVALVCALQGLPLLIGLVAAQVGSRRLGDLRRDLERDGLTLTAGGDAQRVVESVWKQLVPELQQGYGRLSIFPGKFSREAALIVLGHAEREVNSGKEERVEGLLEQLLRRSLLSHERYDHDLVQQRELYGFHPLLREHARAWLENQPGELALARQHFAAYFSSFVPTIAADMVATENLNHIAWDEENFLHFLETSVSQGEWILARTLVEPILWHFYRSGRFERGMATFRRAASLLESHSGQEPEVRLTLGHLLCAQAWLEHWADHFEVSSRYAQRGVALIEAEDPHDKMILVGHASMGSNLYRQGHYGAAALHLDQTLALGRQLEDKTGVLRSSMHGYWGRIFGGDYDQVSGFIEESHRIIQDLGLKDHLFVAEFHTLQGFLKLCQGDVANGMGQLEVGREMCLRIGHTTQLLINLNFYAVSLLMRILGTLAAGGTLESVTVTMHTLRGCCEEVRQHTRYVESRVAYAFATASLAAVRTFEGDPTGARELLLEAVRESWMSDNRACLSYALTVQTLTYLAQDDLEQGLNLGAFLQGHDATVAFCRTLLTPQLERAQTLALELGVSAPQLSAWEVRASRLNLQEVVQGILESTSRG